MLGSSFEQLDRFSHTLQTSVEISNPIQGGGVVWIGIQDREIGVDGRIQLAPTHESLSIANELLTISSHQ